jgi:hypothetical protein
MKTYVKGTGIVAKALDKGERIQWTDGLSDYYINGVMVPQLSPCFQAIPFLRWVYSRGSFTVSLRGTTPSPALSVATATTH